MLLNDSFDDFRRDRVIPGSVGINDGDRPLLANPQAVCFRAIDTVGGAREAQLFKTSFEVVPRLQTGPLRCALRVRLIGAEEDVLSDVLDPELFNELFE